MSVNVSKQEDVVIIELAGKIMGGPEASEINDQVHTQIDQNYRKILIDLAQVDWMNSSGLGILIGAMTTLKNNDGVMGLVNASERIKNLLKITKLLEVFHLYDNLEEAIADMK
ncbi:MAG: anti-sigma factor antagonist [Caldithrix sp.]|nr:anti-sigma factor antagonist [Caldithrix sp.]